VYRRFPSSSTGQDAGMSETLEEPEREDDLLEEQEDKGYGEDEGDREEALPDE
jgi:hypothetical protein